MCGEGCSCEDAEEPNYTPPTPEPGEEGVVEASTQCVEVVGGLSLASGPGAELTKIIAWIGLTPAPGCKCKKRARYMDKMGCDWCEQNMSQIIGWLQEEHTRTKSLLPFVSFAAEKLVRLAIRRARQGNSQ
jgi:hypothetical protein